MPNIKWVVAAIAVTVGVVGIGTWGVFSGIFIFGGSDTEVSLNFAPNGGGSFNINCTNQPPSYADVKLYTPEVTFSQPLSSDITLFFEVKAARTLRSDPILAFFSVSIPAGTTAWTTMATAANAGANVTPPGTPTTETQGFWLTCTKKCKVRGNVGHDNDEHANTYLDMFLLGVNPGSVNIGGDNQSPRHVVRCT